MPITLPNLPNLAGTNVTPNVPTHVLADTDITVVNSSATLGIGADRKVTLGELAGYLGQSYTTYAEPTTDCVQAEWRTIKTLTLTAGIKYAIEGHVIVQPGTGETLPPLSVDLRLFSGSTTYLTRYSGKLAQDAAYPMYTLEIPKTIVTGITSLNLDAYGIVGTGGAAQYKVTTQLLVSRVRA